MFFLTYNNALIADELCAKSIITASKVKNFSINGSSSKSLSECKYYSVNSKKLFLYSFGKKKICSCVVAKDLKILSLLINAEKSESLNLCRDYMKQFITKLNSIVNNITSCKKD